MSQEGLRFVALTPELRPLWQAGVAALEGAARYPLGEDFFRIDHGADYFAFFDRLGQVVYHLAADGERVAAVGCGILRQVAYGQGEPPRAAWYLCDVKVDPPYRGRHIPLRMLGRAFWRYYLRCPRGYAVTMDPAGGLPNPVVRLAQRFRGSFFEVGAKLHFYSLDAEAMAAAAPLVEAHRGPIAYRDLGGVKELLLASSGRPLPLIHVQWGPGREAEAQPRPLPDHAHMFCCPAGEPLELALQARGHAPMASATVLHHRMHGSDWRFILSSDI